jgi:hypothetical protein
MEHGHNSQKKKMLAVFRNSYFAISYLSRRRPISESVNSLS